MRNYIRQILFTLSFLILMLMNSCYSDKYDFPDFTDYECLPDEKFVTYTNVVGTIYEQDNYYGNYSYDFISRSKKISLATQRFGFSLCNNFSEKSFIKQRQEISTTIEIQEKIPKSGMTKARIKSIINLEENPQLDPRFKGDYKRVIVNVTGYNGDTTTHNKPLLINSVDDLKKYNLETKLPFDFVSYSIVGNSFGTGGCTFDFEVMSSTLRKKTSVDLTIFPIGGCRQSLRVLVFLKIPKTLNYRDLKFTLKFK